MASACLCLPRHRRHTDLLGRPQLLPRTLQRCHGLPEGIASHEDIVEQAQQRDGLWHQIHRRDDRDKRDDQHRLRVCRHLQLGVSEHR